MEIILGKSSGFCYGVRNAIYKTEEKLKEFSEISCLGELVHNKQVIDKLNKFGLKIINKIEDAKARVIIRAHGISKQEYIKARKLNINIYDFTCPNVLEIHKIAETYADDGFFIFLLGSKTHPENIGSISFCGKNSFIIETEEDLEDGIKKLEKSKIKKLLILVQTTFNLEAFLCYVRLIKQKLGSDMELVVKNTICNATRIRQEETMNISKNVEAMIIIGGKNSSNTKKLFEISKQNCKNTICVETKEDLNIEKFKQLNKIGIMAGASTPDESIKEIIEVIKNIKA